MSIKSRLKRPVPFGNYKNRNSKDDKFVFVKTGPKVAVVAAAAAAEAILVVEDIERTVVAAVVAVGTARPPLAHNFLLAICPSIPTGVI